MKALKLFSLFVITISLVACSASEENTSSTDEPLFKAEFGVQAYTFRNQFKDSTWTTEAIIDTIAALGITELEGGVPAGYDAASYKELVNSKGISIVSTGAGFGQLEEDPMVVVEQAKALGASYVMCAWIPHEDGFDFDDAKKAVEVFNAAGKVFAENDLIFCYHDHGYEFKPNPEGEGTLMDYIIENTNPEHVSFQMDVLWTIHGGGPDMPQQLLEKYGDRWKLMHVKDLKKGVIGDGTGHTPAENDVIVGTGQANWPEILKLANEVGMKHFFIEDESENEFVHIPQSMEYLKSL